MPNDNEKLARFEKAVFSEMETKAAEILSEVDSYKEEKLGGVQDAELQRAYDLIQRKAVEIRAGFARDITREKLSARQRVLLRRKELTEELFQKAADKIQQYTKTEEYTSLLKDMIQKHTDSETKILVREADETLVRSLVKGNPIEVTGQIVLGGLIFVNESRRSYEDFTFDSRLKSAEENFYHSGKAELSTVEGVGELD